MTTVEQQSGCAISSFHVESPEAAPDDLRRRPRGDPLAQSRARRRPVAGRATGDTSGVRRYWAGEYDVHRAEARLNALPQFTTRIDGVDIHVVRVLPRHEEAAPLIITDGRPGSVIEIPDSVDPLTDPTAHDDSAADAFVPVLPSHPGYGFAGEPTEVGGDGARRTLRSWAEKTYPTLTYFSEAARGGHFAAGENPELLAAEIRAAFRALR